MFCKALPRVFCTASRPILRYQGQNPLRSPLAPSITIRQWPRPRDASFQASARKLYAGNPVTFTMACVFIVSGFGGLIYGSYYYNKYIVEQYRRFPEPVAIKLRRAVYYTNNDLDAKKATDYYRQALVVADELGMDPFSDEVIGIKLQFSALAEKVHQYQNAIDVLETVRSDCEKWLEIVGTKEGRQGDRTRILAKIVGMNVKLGELYSNQYVEDHEAAEAKLLAAVQISQDEYQRRESEGVKEGEGPWLSIEEMGGSLEALADHYEQQNKHYLAAPLYLRALSLLPSSTCHAVILMNNLSISLAQQVPPPQSSTPPASRSQLVSNARTWAQKSLEIAAALKPPVRDEECDMGCAVAMHNLGEFAEMDGDLAEARKKYDEAKGLSRAIGFNEGVARANEGLKRLEKRF